jgi:hypothetical protein
LASFDYKENLRNTLNEMNPDGQQQQLAIPSTLFSTLKFQSEKVLDCYFQLRDWEEYLSWYDEFKVKVLDRIENENFKNQFEKKIDLNYIKSMKSFESQDFQEAERLSAQFKIFSSDGSSLEETLTKNFQQKWDIEELETITLKEIYKNALKSKSENSRIVNYEKFMCSSLVSSINMDENSLWNNQKVAFAALSKLSNEDFLNSSFGKNLKLDPMKHSIKFLNHVQMLACVHKHDIDEHLEFKLAYAKLARKQENFKLASRTLANIIKDITPNYSCEIVDLNESIKNFVYTGYHFKIDNLNRQNRAKVLIGKKLSTNLP